MAHPEHADQDLDDPSTVEDLVLDGQIVDAEIVEDTPTEPLPIIDIPSTELVPVVRPLPPMLRQVVTLRTRTMPAVRSVVAAAQSRPAVNARRSVVAAGRAGRRHSWYLLAGAGVAYQRINDAHGGGRYERMMRRAEVAGDHESLLQWEARDVAEKDRRHRRVMDWLRSPAALIKAVGVALLGFTALLLVLGIILAIGTRDIAQVLAPLLGAANLVVFVAWVLATYGALLLMLATGGGVVYLWNTGRTRADQPTWTTTTTAGPATGGDGGGRDVVPDERAVVNALRNLNLPALNKKFREGWAPRWELPPVYDGKGWRCQLLLPEGVTVTKINERKDVLAHNLLRLPVEVWPTEPRNKPGFLDLWVADQGSLTKPVAPWPLLTTGTCDFFKGVPVGVDPRGNTIIGRFFQANWGVAGMMGSGKSTLIITALLGLALDPLVEIDVYCMAINADYDPLRPRLRTLFVSDDPDQIPTVLAGLKQLMSDLSDRGRKLSAAGEPKLTRALAAADPTMRPRVVVIDECQELFISDVGEEATELVEKIVAKARKYGVTLIFATPVPSADSLPRKVAKVLSNRACFAIADHQGNDAILGTGKHTAGITATTLQPMTINSDGTVDLGDLGTAMTSGFTPTDGLMRCYYVRRGDGVDDVTPVVERAMAGYRPQDATPTDVDGDSEPVEPLVDIAAVLDGHKRLRTQQVLADLAARDKPRYGDWTPAQLKAYLAQHGIRVIKSSEGHMSVRTPDVLTALHHSDTTDDDEDTDAITHGDFDDVEDHGG